jgi:hypothetical protein
MDRIGVDVHQRSQGSQGVDLGERVEETILLVRGQRPGILPDAQIVFMVVVTGDRRLVVLLAGLEAGMLVWMGDVDRRFLRGVLPIDPGIGIARVVGWAVSVLWRVLVVGIFVRGLVRLVSPRRVLVRAVTSVSRGPLRLLFPSSGRCHVVLLWTLRSTHRWNSAGLR